MCVLRSLVVWPLAGVLLAGAATFAFAQDADSGLRSETLIDDEAVAKAVTSASRITIGDDEVVKTRRRRKSSNAFAAQGLDAGAFRLFPSLEVSSFATSNAKRSSTQKDGDVGLQLRPSLRWESDWSRHSFSGEASLNGGRYLDNSDLTSVGAELSAAGRIDILRTTRADVNGRYALTSTAMENSGVPATAKGKRIDQVLSFGAGVTHDFGGVEGGLRLGAARNVFGDVDLVGGGTETNKDRNYNEVTVAARAALRGGSIVQPFAEVAYMPRFHDKTKDRNGVKRNSQGVRAATGLAFDDGALWSGDIALTFDVRNYEDTSLATVKSPGLLANVTWRPTDLTRFEFNSGASLAETIAAGEGATKSWTFGVKGTHALRENIELTGGLNLTVERAGGAASHTTVGSLGINWVMNPSLVIGASYDGTWFNGEAPNSDYSEQRLLTRLIIRQ